MQHDYGKQRELLNACGLAIDDDGGEISDAMDAYAEHMMRWRPNDETPELDQVIECLTDDNRSIELWEYHPDFKMQNFIGWRPFHPKENID